jgi:hypothetical protein
MARAKSRSTARCSVAPNRWRSISEAGQLICFSSSYFFRALALTSVDEAVPKLEWLATATDSVTTQSSELPTPPRLLANKCARSLRDVPNVRVEDKQREHGRQLAFASAAFFARGHPDIRLQPREMQTRLLYE